MYIPGEYYRLAGITILLCESPGIFITNQGRRARVHSDKLEHLPNYIKDGGEPFALGKHVGLHQSPLKVKKDS